jgi:hypothetical protein
MGAPDGAEISGSGLYRTMVVDVMSGKRSARDALKDTQRQLQAILDNYKQA